MGAFGRGAFSIMSICDFCIYANRSFTIRAKGGNDYRFNQNLTLEFGIQEPWGGVTLGGSVTLGGGGGFAADCASWPGAPPRRYMGILSDRIYKKSADALVYVVFSVVIFFIFIQFPLCPRAPQILYILIYIVVII